MGSKVIEKNSFFGQFLKRPIIRIGAMYLVASWVLLQFGEIMIDFMELPSIVGRALIVLLALGFPFVMILAWVFNKTLEGHNEVYDGKNNTYQNNKIIDRAIYFGAFVAICMSFYIYQRTSEETQIDSTFDNEPTQPLIKTQNASATNAKHQYILIGNLVDFTGSTGQSGQSYGQAIIDSTNWINENGGINGRLIDLDTIETSYLVRRAIDAYKKWKVQGVSAIQGWGTHIGIALRNDINDDQVPFFSASYSAEFTDPLGTNTGKPTPYNFFYSPSYSDGCRGLLEWAKNDWEKKKENELPMFLYMGDNNPYANAPKEACEIYAKEIGFELLPSLSFSMIPQDYSKQCKELERFKPDYVFLANLDKSVASLLRQCHDKQNKIQFMVNIYGFDESVIQSAGIAANNVVWVVASASWEDSYAGMYTVREISKMSDPENNKYRTLHYIRGVCSMFFLKDAILQADLEGQLSGSKIKRAMYREKEWVPEELEGVCLPSNWSESDHRGTNTVLIYQATVNENFEKGSLKALFDKNVIEIRQVFRTQISRRPDWLGY